MWPLTDDSNDGKFLPVELRLWLKVGVQTGSLPAQWPRLGQLQLEGENKGEEVTVGKRSNSK